MKSIAGKQNMEESRSQKKWTTEDTQKLTELSEKNVPDILIAAELGRSVKAVYDRRSINKQKKSRTANRSQKKWTATEISESLELHHQGFSDKKIGVKIGRSEKAVQLKRLHMKEAVNGPRENKTITRKQLAEELEPAVNELFGTEYDPYPYKENNYHLKIPKKIIFAATIVVVAIAGWAAGFYG